MPGTVVDRIRDRKGRDDARLALIEGTREWTFGELWERVDRLSSALLDLGARQGDAVLAFLPNVHEAVECELAALSSGLAWITLTSRLTWAEVRGVIASCAPRLLVTSASGAAKIAGGLSELPLDPMPDLILIGDAGATPSLPGARSYEALLLDHAPRRAEVDVTAEDVARLRYTSGTTGSAKASVLPHRVYHASLDNLLAELAPVSEEDRALHVAPLTHGSGALLYPVLYAGGVNVLDEHFDVEAVFSLIERHRITMMFTVPTMLSRLVASPRFDEHDVSSLRALIYGGAPMPTAQLDTAITRAGHALHQIYGMTEAPWPITILKPKDHVPGGVRRTSVGRATTVCEVRVVDPEGRTLGADGIGELQVRGRNVMKGYFRDASSTRAVLHDGWLSTGDVGKIDENGYVFIVGRKKDVIISGGFNVYAAEVEAALSSDPRILEIAVVGLPHDDWGELVAAFVVPRPGATITPAEIDALARSRLSGYKCPRRIDLVDDLPKTATGKIQKSEIARRLKAT